MILRIKKYGKIGNIMKYPVLFCVCFILAGCDNTGHYDEEPGTGSSITLKSDLDGVTGATEYLDDTSISQGEAVWYYWNCDYGRRRHRHSYYTLLTKESGNNFYISQVPDPNAENGERMIKYNFKFLVAAQFKSSGSARCRFYITPKDQPWNRVAQTDYILIPYKGGSYPFVTLQEVLEVTQTLYRDYVFGIDYYCRLVNSVGLKRVSMKRYIN